MSSCLTNRVFLFDRSQIDAKLLRTVSKQQCMDVLDRYVLGRPTAPRRACDMFDHADPSTRSKSACRRKLAVFIHGNGSVPNVPSNVSQSSSIFSPEQVVHLKGYDELMRFKRNRLALYPICKPPKFRFVQVPLAPHVSPPNCDSQL